MPLDETISHFLLHQTLNVIQYLTFLSTKNYFKALVVLFQQM